MKYAGRCLCWVAALALLGCSSLRSTGPLKGDEIGDGLVYHLPRKDIVVTLTSDGTKFTGLAVSTTPAYADLDQPYLLRFQSSLLAQHEIKVSVSEAGLLSTASTKTTPQIAELLEPYAQLENKTFRSPAAGVAAVDCDPTMSHSHVVALPRSENEETKLGGAATSDGFHFEVKSPSCENVTVKVKRLWDWPSTVKPAQADAAETAESGQPSAAGRDGVFYRRNRPYLVRATYRDSAGSRQTVVEGVFHSPSASPASFLPIERGFFASNLSTLGFRDGVPEKYEQTKDGELAALLKLPATIVEAYFGAVGGLFKHLGTAREAETASLTKELTLEIARAKVQACLDALRRRDTDTLARLQCEK